MIRRDACLDQILPYMNKPLIKIITGIRRSGKSTLMKLLQERLLSRGVAETDIIYINFESMRYYDLRTSVKLYDHIMQRTAEKESVYLFFDEIQVVEHWEEAVNSFLVDLNADIYLTGSNSNLLSSELSTLLTGRYVQFRLYPLSYAEMMNFRQVLIGEHALEEPEWQFIRLGGFPSIHIADYDEDAAYKVINDIYDSIVLRDVVDRYKIRNIELLNRIMRFVMDNVGNTFSAKRIADYFKSQYRKIEPITIYNYMEALQSAYIIEKVNRYDLHGREILKTQEKYYLADQGIQHAVFGYRDRNISGVLENIVYNELRRRGWQVYVGRLKDKEIDFVAERRNDKIYIQVAYRMDSEQTLHRELEPLLMVRDHYPKYILTMDEHYHDNLEGIRHINLFDFISSEDYLD